MSLRFDFLFHHPQLVPQVIRWWHSVWADRMGDDFPALERQLRESLTTTGLPAHVIAFDKEEPIAVAALKLQELADLFPDRQYWLGSVFVVESQRGRHVASQLTQHIIDLATARGLPHLYLQTQNTSGGLYARLGWNALQKLTVRGEQTLLMIRHLEENG